MNEEFKQGKAGKIISALSLS